MAVQSKNFADTEFLYVERFSRLKFKDELRMFMRIILKTLMLPSAGLHLSTNQKSDMLVH